MTKLLDPNPVCATKIGFPIESLCGGRMHTRVVFHYDIASIEIEQNEHEADADIAADRVESFDSMDDLILNLESHRSRP